jgi:hypothetical protein
MNEQRVKAYQKFKSEGASIQNGGKGDLGAAYQQFKLDQKKSESTKTLFGLKRKQTEEKWDVNIGNDIVDDDDVDGITVVKEDALQTEHSEVVVVDFMHKVASAF